MYTFDHICIYIYTLEIYADILSDILSGIYSDILSAIYSGILSGGSGRGPAVPTEIWSSQLRFASAHWDLEFAVGGRRKGGKEGRKEGKREVTLITYIYIYTYIS